MSDKPTLCIVGLGYVGLPLAHAFAEKGFEVYGFDINEKRIAELQEGHDSTDELTDDQLHAVQITLSNDPSVIGKAEIIIVALPTPVDDNNKPDLRILESGTATVGKHMKSGSIVVFESTVYPGTTEEICGPILERESGLKCGVDFTLGYSPERINPGDKEHTVTRIIKVVSGQDDATLQRLLDLYGSVVEAGVHPAANIKVAEMAKAIENAQRDLNIAFVNEIALLSNRIGINTHDVLEAAKTKWNFLPFSPGLVGGHCIGVDPYYLVEKARQLGMDTHVITAGRAVNDGMGRFVASQICEGLGNDSHKKVLLLGLTFKENVPDTRNSRVKDVAQELVKAGHEVFVHDPLTNDSRATNGYTWGTLKDGPYDAVALLVPHKFYKELPIEDLISATKDGGLIYDLKSVLSAESIIANNRRYITL